MKVFISKFDLYLEKLSRWGIILSLALILGLAVFSIILRWLGMSPLWLEPLIRHLVFISAFFGGSLATSKGVHIKVDILTHLIEKSSSKVLRWLHTNLIAFFCFLTTLILLKSSWDFYLMEKEFGAEAFLGIHSSYLVAIIPAGVGLISLRFFNRLVLGVLKGGAIEPYRL
jgi:TRAP-type C4-dicarboxylate transport system permease small subunit